ncbi:MAG: hypothetical protein KDC56_13165 [Flavobacteriaceae bacterium]|nr:hypothetical protein [Flavobacteriaceae bacterium]
MHFKNYTSETPVSNSMGKIEKCLVSAGATGISKKYNDGICTSITFRMMVNNIPLFFQLPAKVEACFEVLYKEIKRPRPDTRLRVRAQAERTAWKLVCDWVEVQLSMIMLEQADALEVFLPYVYDPQSDVTFYNKLKHSGFKALLPPSKQ